MPWARSDRLLRDPEAIRRTDSVYRRVVTCPDGLALDRRVDVVGRIVLPGVRTRGSAVGGRREYYGPLDLQHLTTPAVTWPGANQGPLAPVAPRVRFGFESMPRTPSLTRVATLVEAG